MQNNNKQPARPQKQGGLYSLNLGQNNGPFLTKDIMLTNDKSLSLLRTKDNVAKYASKILQPNNVLEQYGQMSLGYRSGALEINQPQDYYDDNQRAYQNYDERFKAKQNAAENLASNATFVENQTKQLQKNWKYYLELTEKLRNDLENLHDKIHFSNMDNIREIQPMLKDFHLKLKDKLIEGKDENYQLQREMEQLQREKLQIQEQILFSHKRILDLEKNVGIIKEDQSDQDEDEDQQQQDEQDSNLQNNYQDYNESNSISASNSMSQDQYQNYYH